MVLGFSEEEDEQGVGSVYTIESMILPCRDICLEILSKRYLRLMSIIYSEKPENPVNHGMYCALIRPCTNRFGPISQYPSIRATSLWFSV